MALATLSNGLARQGLLLPQFLHAVALDLGFGRDFFELLVALHKQGEVKAESLKLNSRSPALSSLSVPCRARKYSATRSGDGGSPASA